MTWIPPHLFRNPAVRAAGAIALANLLFFVLVFAGQGDPCVSLARVQAAFEGEDLQTKDFLFKDARRGWFQFNDCNVLQMLTNPEPSRLARALAPTVYRENDDWEGQCRVLRALVSEWVDPRTLLSLRYSRYWHGYNVVAALGLRFLELRNLRRVLVGLVWISIAVLAAASIRSGLCVRRTGLSVALAAATVWGVPYLAPGLTQGPGDALLLLALAPIAARPRMATDLGRIVPYAAGFGAAVVFFEMLTGQLPIAVAWLAAMTLAAARDEARPSRPAPARIVLAAIVAFGVGAIATVGVKIALATALVAPQADSDFASRLGLYTRIPDWASYSPSWVSGPLARLPGILLPFARLVLKTNMLAFGSVRAGYGLVATAAIAWLAAVALGLRSWRSPGGQDRLVLAAAALVPAAWVCLLPSHTYIHATFMVRILVVPISLAPLALFWPRLRENRSST